MTAARSTPYKSPGLQHAGAGTGRALGQVPRYFTERDARDLIGRRVQARVTLSRHWLRDLGLWIGAGSCGTVTQFAFGPEPDQFLAGIHWDDPRPAIPRRPDYPIDWYTEDEYRTLLGACPVMLVNGVPVEAAA